MTSTITPVLTSAYQKFGTGIPEGTSALEALEAAGMTGWNQRLVVPEIVEGGIRYPAGGLRVNVADTPIGPRVMGVVKEGYRPIQIEEAFLPLMDGFGNYGLQPMVVGAWDDGRAAYIQFRVPGSSTGSADPISTTLLVTKRNDGTGAVRAYPVAERVACANQIDGIAKSHRVVVAVRHTRHADPYVTQTAERLLGLVNDWDEILRTEIEHLQRIPVSYADFADRIVPAVLGERPEEEGRGQTIYDNKFAAIVDSWSSPVAAEGDDAWRAWNAFSEWEQHHRTTAEARMARAVLADRQPLSDRALAVLTA
jgi:hypothetical protein